MSPELADEGGPISAGTGELGQRVSEAFALHDRVVHADGSSGRIVALHPDDAELVLVQWADEPEADWTPTDMISPAPVA